MKSNLDLVSFLFCCNLLSFSFFFQFLALVLIFLFSFILLCINYFLIPHHNGLTNILRFYPRFSCSNILCLYFLLFASTLSYFVLFSFKINFVLYLMADAFESIFISLFFSLSFYFFCSSSLHPDFSSVFTVVYLKFRLLYVLVVRPLSGDCTYQFSQSLSISLVRSKFR